MNPSDLISNFVVLIRQKLNVSRFCGCSGFIASEIQNQFKSKHLIGIKTQLNSIYICIRSFVSQDVCILYS